MKEKVHLTKERGIRLGLTKVFSFCMEGKGGLLGLAQGAASGGKGLKALQRKALHRAAWVAILPLSWYTATLADRCQGKGGKPILDSTARHKRASGQDSPWVRGLALCSLLVLLITTLPLYVISFYNYPYYDDYGFSTQVHEAWLQTGSLAAVVKAAWQSANAVRDTWQGTYTGTLLSNLQPGVFDEGLYFVTTFFLLTFFLVSFGYFFVQVFRGLLGVSFWHSLALCSLALTLLLQLMPDPDEAFYWFNGGVGNTFIYALLALSLGLCARLERGASRLGWWLGGIALVLTMVLLGGGSYGGGLLGLCLYGGLCLWAFRARRPTRWLYLCLWLVFAAGFAYSISAPGNTVRAGIIAYEASPVKAIAQALYYGTALAGSYVRLPLVAVTLLVLPGLYQAAKESPHAFAHPWLLLGGGLCLYCTQLVPPLYAGVFIGGGRIVDTYWQSFVVLWLLYAYYLAGWVARRLEDKGLELLSPDPRLRRWMTGLACALLLLGCLGYKLPNDSLYGLPNLAGGSAALSLAKGEAQQYHQEMVAREALLRDPGQPAVTLAPLTVVPDIFMEDLLAPGAVYDVRPTLCAYYGKASIAIEGEGDGP